jgi:probable F420-dependent oxidoreductase
MARQVLGPGGLVLPEQAVALIDDPALARALAREHLDHYFTLPNYVNNWRRFGFNDDDFADGGSDRLIDAVVAWGDEEAISARVAEHFEAGADHVCVQVLSDQGMLPRQLWRVLAPALTAASPAATGGPA